MYNDICYWAVDPSSNWYRFEGYGKKQYFIDPCKFQLTTSGLNRSIGKYENFDISVNILINYLRDNGIVADKFDLNTILCLMTPAETMAKMKDVVNKFIKFEKLIEDDISMEIVLPIIYEKYQDRYKKYSIRKLCQEMHNFYKERNVALLQKRLFLKEFFPKVAMNTQEANYEYIRGMEN